MHVYVCMSMFETQAMIDVPGSVGAAVITTENVAQVRRAVLGAGCDV